MLNYWYSDNESGEEFFVQEKNKEQADIIAHEIFGNDLEYYGAIPDEHAEIMGLDTY